MSKIAERVSKALVLNHQAKSDREIIERSILDLRAQQDEFKEKRQQAQARIEAIGQESAGDFLALRQEKRELEQLIEDFNAALGMLEEKEKQHWVPLIKAQQEVETTRGELKAACLALQEEFEEKRMKAIEKAMQAPLQELVGMKEQRALCTSEEQAKAWFDQKVFGICDEVQKRHQGQGGDLHPQAAEALREPVAGPCDDVIQKSNTPGLMHRIKHGLAH